MKRIISVFLSLILVFSAFSLTTFGSDSELYSEIDITNYMDDRLDF